MKKISIMVLISFLIIFGGNSNAQDLTYLHDSPSVDKYLEEADELRRQELVKKQQIEILKQKLEEENRRKEEEIRKQPNYNFNEKADIPYTSLKEDKKIIKDTLKEQRLTVKQKELFKNAVKYLGKEYKLGADEKSHKNKAYDCSSFTQSVFNKIGTKIPRTAREQYRAMDKIDIFDAVPGDLVFYERTYPINGASHVGIYIGNGNMIHASAYYGVIRVESVLSPYLRDKFLGFARPNRKD